MKALVKLKLKENRKGSIFIIFAILGILLSLLVTSSVTFSTNVGGDVSTDYSQYGYQWTFLSFLASLAAVSLSMNTVEKHRKGNFSELLTLHGLGKQDQYRALALANVGLVVQMGLVLILGMVISLFIKKPDFSLIGFVLAVINYLGGAITMALIMSLLTLVFPSVVSGLLGILLSLLGTGRSLFEILVANKGGLFGQVGTLFFKLVPSLSSFGQVSRDLFFGEFTDWQILLENAFYLWALIGVLYLTTWVVSKNEK